MSLARVSPSTLGGGPNSRRWVRGESPQTRFSSRCSARGGRRGSCGIGGMRLCNSAWTGRSSGAFVTPPGRQQRRAFRTQWFAVASSSGTDGYRAYGGFDASFLASRASWIRSLALALIGAALAQPAASFYDRDCADFKTQKQAQRFFKKHNPNRDPHRLDGDVDGMACEDLP